MSVWHSWGFLTAPSSPTDRAGKAQKREELKREQEREAERKRGVEREEEEREAREMEQNSNLCAKLTRCLAPHPPS